MLLPNMLGRRSRNVILGPGGPAVFFNDTFSGETSTVNLTTHTPEQGVAWRLLTGNWGVTAAGRAYSAATTSLAVNIVAPSPDYYVEGVIDVVTTAASGTGISGRISDDGVNFYHWRWLSGKWQLYSFTSAGAVLLGEYADTFTSGSRTVRLLMQGDQISGWVDGVQRVFVTDATVSGPGMVGMRDSTSLSATTGRQITSLMASTL